MVTNFSVTSCDSKYTKCHKCKEKKLFYIYCEEEEEKEQEMSKEEDIHQEQTIEKEEMNPTISCNALAGITTPQTIKIEGHIKKKKVTMLIDSGSTHNFIHCKIAKELNFFLYPAPECQVMVASGGTITYSRKCHNIKLSMGEYVLNSPMLSIPMGGADVVLGVQWLQSLGTITFNFQELFMKFYVEGKEFELRGIVGKLGKIISSNEATKAFEHLKEEMCQAPVLVTMDFTKSFIVECDTLGNGIGVFLMQEERPIDFKSRPIKGKYLHKAIYEKEMLAILHALKKWRPYLMGRHFKEKTNHDSLKYFLEQRLSLEERQKWVTKMLGYDFEIIYKKGKQNVVADAPSRKYEDVEAFLCTISIIQPDWINEARDEWKNEKEVWALIQRLQQDPSTCDRFCWKNDSLCYKDWLYLCKNS
eukprot:PITA_04772